jgi:DNA repair protein RecO (recombination protein O)
MYSKEDGLIKGVAKGCKKPKSKLGARMDLMVANNLLISNGRNLNTICEAKSINTFKNSRQDINKLMYSSYITELTASFGVENDPGAKEVYSLLYDTLDSINNSNNKIEILISVIKFQLKFMQITGFGIEFETCLSCQKELKSENIYFSLKNGGVFCEKCINNNDNLIKLHFKIRDFLVSLLNTDLNKHNEYEKLATEKICKTCFDLLKSYVQIHCAKQIKSIELIETTCN